MTEGGNFFVVYCRFKRKNKNYDTKKRKINIKKHLTIGSI